MRAPGGRWALCAGLLVVSLAGVGGSSARKGEAAAGRRQRTELAAKDQLPGLPSPSSLPNAGSVAKMAGSAKETAGKASASAAGAVGKVRSAAVDGLGIREKLDALIGDAKGVQAVSMRGMLEKAESVVGWEAPSLVPPPPAWKPLRPYHEHYEHGDYTLSGGIFQSFDREHCHQLSIKFGKCMPPCARYIGDRVSPDLFPGNEHMTAEQKKRSEALHGKWSKSKVDEYAEKVEEAKGDRDTVLALPADPADASMDCLVHRPALDPNAEDHCLCVDPCRRYTTCGECTQNKASHMEPPEGADPATWKPPHWAAVGSPYNCGWCQNKCVSGNRAGPTIGGDTCLVWNYKPPQCQPMSVREAPQLPDEPGTDCAQLRYSECSAPCKWVGWTRFTGYCELAPEGAAAEGSVEGAAAQDVAEGGGEAANLEPAF